MSAFPRSDHAESPVSGSLVRRTALVKSVARSRDYRHLVTPEAGFRGTYTNRR